MFPYIHTVYGNIPTFVICIIIGILSMFYYIHGLLKSQNCLSEEKYIFPKIICCGLVGYFFAGFFDTLFKYFNDGQFKVCGITFYGGLLSAVATLYLQLLFCKKTKYKINEWFDLLTPPFIVFHFLGRIGCFFAGCCYGKITESWIGVYFPDNIELGIKHHGFKCYPTQLFEAFALLLILIVLKYVKRKFKTYLILYSCFRFILEFYRGDNRGYLSDYFSPAQLVSITILFVMCFFKIYCILKKQKRQEMNKYI